MTKPRPRPHQDPDPDQSPDQETGKEEKQLRLHRLIPFLNPILFSANHIILNFMT